MPRFFGSFFGPFLSLFFVLLASLAFAQPNGYEKGQLFVRVTANSSLDLHYDKAKGDQIPVAELRSEFLFYGISRITAPFILDDPALQNTYLIEYDPATLGMGLRMRWEDIEGVELAEFVPRYEPFFTPNDFNLLQWNLQTINAELAWDIDTGSSDVLIAIVDDAVLTSHIDLFDNIWTNPGEIPNNGIDDDANGYIDDVNGWDAADGDNDPNPGPGADPAYFSHGTHCAGIAAAATNNGTGIASIGYHNKIVPVKIGLDATSGLSNAYAGVQYAILADADIISMSWGGGAYSNTYQTLIDNAWNDGIILVAAAGNSNTSVPMYPASYNNVFSVAASDQGDAKATFSNYGSTIDVTAPGVNIYSTVAGAGANQYDTKSGTSMACPLVSGLAALIKSSNATMTNQEILDCISTTAVDISAQNPGFNGMLGSGRIDAEAALLCAQQAYANFEADQIHVCPGMDVQFTDLSSPDITSWDWTFAGGTPATSTAQNPLVNYAGAGTYDITLTVTNAQGTDTETKVGYITVGDPTATLSGGGTIAPGFSIALQINFTGAPPWSVTYTDGSTPVTESNIQFTPYFIPVSPGADATYSLVSVSDANCAGTVSGTADVTVNTNAGNCSAGLAYTKTIGGPGLDESEAINLTPDGGVIISGRTNSWGQGGTDVYIVKLDDCHDLEWAQAIGTTSDDWGRSVIPTIDGGYALSAYTNLGFGGLDMYVLKLDAAGNSLWSQTYGLGNADYPRDLVELPDGSLIFGGVTNTPSITNGANDFLVARIDVNGNLIWSKSFGNNSNDFLHHIEVDQYGHILLAGYRRNYTSPSSHHGYLIKINQSGNVLWAKTYDSPGDEVPVSIKAVDNGYLMTGRTNSFGAGMDDAHVMLLDTAGNVVWSKVYGGSQFENGVESVDAQGGGYYMLATTESFGAGQRDILLVKLDANGTVETARTIGGTMQETVTGAGTQMEVYPDGSLLITANTESFGEGAQDAMIIRTTVDGLFICDSSTVLVTETNAPMTVVNNTPQVLNAGISNAASLDQTFAAPAVEIVECEEFFQACDQTTFQRTFGDADDENAEDVAVAIDGGFYLAGTTNNGATGTRDWMVVRTNHLGQQIWAQTIGGLAVDSGTNVCITATADGGAMFTGRTQSYGAQGDDAYCARLDQAGTLLWEVTIPGSGNDYLRSVEQTSDLGFILAGSTNSFSVGGSTDGWVVKLDQNGVVEWTSVTGGSSSDHLMDAQELPNGNFIVCGHYRSLGGSNSSSTYLAEYDVAGTLLWEKIYSGPGGIGGTKMTLTDDGGYLIAGPTDAYGAGMRDMSLLKTDSLGVFEWMQTYGGTLEERATAVVQTADGGYGVLGFSESFGAGSEDMVLLKVDSLGNQEWTSVAGGVNTEIAGLWSGSIAATLDGGFIIAGETNSFTAGDRDMYLLKMNACGETSCNEQFVSLTTGTAVPTESVPAYSVGTGGTTGAVTSTVAFIAPGDSVLCMVNNEVICGLQANFNADTVCIGDTTHFTDLSTDSIASIVYWKWLFGDGDSLLGTANPSHVYAANGTYNTTLIVGNNDAPACFDTTVVAVLVVDQLTASLPGNDTICLNDSAALGAVTLTCGLPPYTYAWAPAASVGSPTAGTTAASPGATTTYTITVTDATGATTTASQTVVVDQSCCVAIASFAAPAIVCEGDSTTIINTSSASGAASWTWDFGPNAVPSSFVGQDPPTLYFSTLGTHDVSLIVSDSCGVDTANFTIGVVPNPVPEAGADTLACLNDLIQLGEAPIGNYQYSWAPGFNLSDSVTANPTTNALVDTTWYVTATDPWTGCSGIDSVTISVDTSCCSTVATFQALPLSACLGLPITVTNNTSTVGTPTFAWNFGSNANPSTFIGANPPQVTFDSSGTYTITLIVSDSCGVDTATQTVTIFDQPVADAGPNISSCAPDTVQLGGVVDSTGIYVWSPSTGFLSPTDDPTPLVDAQTSQTYYLTVFGGGGTCLSIDSVVVSIGSPQVDAGQDAHICQGQSVALGGFGPYPAGTYTWTPTAGLTVPTSPAPLATPDTTTTYFLEYDNGTCSGTDSVTITVFHFVQPDAVAMCPGDTVLLSPAAVDALGSVSYSWSPASELSAPTERTTLAWPSSSVLYTLSGTDSSGCTANVDVDIVIGGTAQAAFSSEFFPSCDSLLAVFTDESTGADSLAWVVNGTYQSSEASPAFRFAYNTDLNVVLEAYPTGGCMDSIALDQSLLSFEDYFDLEAPNVFSPNGDNVNDLFEIGFNNALVECTELSIYNRWGLLIFESSGHDHAWTGRNFDGQLAPEGTYFYTLDVNGNVFTGTVMLLRNDAGQ